jgi:hypothetical protein
VLNSIGDETDWLELTTPLTAIMFSSQKAPPLESTDGIEGPKQAMSLSDFGR